MKKRALITGGSRRLGLSLTQALLQDDWQVIILTRNSSPELEKLRCDSLEIRCCLDLDNPEFEQTIKQLASEYNTLDLIVHNASMYEKDPEIGADISRFYDANYQIHMKLPAIINTYFADSLRHSPTKNANIIHITDIYADNPNVDYILYCSTKAGLANLTKGFAKKYAPAIRVNSIQPGPIKFLPHHTDEHKKNVLSKTLLSFEAGFEPIIKTVKFIVDNPYLTGSAIKVDGGRSIANK